ncbi:type IV pilus modification PilV family protein [Coraliomargarita akajimensis]|uniref:Prepilin-type N-terminal cleavage/methylation domain-containing protein n=1 Tax=Coraliomargarita akajimensis (strain DSM 45221 / IAM 15411 / JCM 23193 / KCTC 12865 / 04OKA010-24) TaxID=583355 RepID=D5EHY9_CORAD|nr:prepilin-type N-terminal cleavage/methylation domain-containing protein [Coraliomargarita akajimensis]ADE56029.1 hypothetical protein Caka_3016 [Coraliomargarita akajimensis DSM 45221]
MMKLHKGNCNRRAQQGGFTLVEVVLALGIFLVTILALVGLLGPTLKSVNDVETTDELVSVVNSINAFLQNSPEIAVSGSSKFDTLYNQVRASGTATIYVFNEYVSGQSAESRLRIGFESASSVGANALVTNFNNASGTIYRAVLSTSPVTPSNFRSGSRNGSGIYTLSSAVNSYHEGFLALEIRIFAREQDLRAIQSGSMDRTTTILANLNNEEPIFTYNTAIVR